MLFPNWLIAILDWPSNFSIARQFKVSCRCCQVRFVAILLLCTLRAMAALEDSWSTERPAVRYRKVSDVSWLQVVRQWATVWLANTTTSECELQDN